LYGGLLHSGLFVRSGKAGSGKTSAIINLVQKFLDDKQLPIYIFTPTGKANLVIRKRLSDVGIRSSNFLKISTIHRWLYTALFETQFTRNYDVLYEMRNKIERILEGKLDLIPAFKRTSSGLKFNPKVVIIDESSMVDELLLALLLCMLNDGSLEHLVLVGDERQLPPIRARSWSIDRCSL